LRSLRRRHRRTKTIITIADTMKTDRFENRSLEKAKENGGKVQRLAVPRPRSVARSAKECAKPRGISERKHLVTAPEPETMVTAKMDVGFGNALFIRGEGGGLSWDKGQPLDCVEGTTWVWANRRAKDHVTFKLLVNDQLWCRGENIRVEPGQTIEVLPAF
jgi:hypothetical protein